MKHQMQPIVFDEEDGVIRFKQNKIVHFLLRAGPFDMNALFLMPFDNDDRMQFVQLIGYSVDGFGELPFADKKVVDKADLLSDKLVAKRARKLKVK